MDPLEKRAPVNGVPYGSISWDEHEKAWEVYHRQYRTQSAERIAERGGFGWQELVEFLGHTPESWDEQGDD